MTWYPPNLAKFCPYHNLIPEGLLSPSQQLSPVSPGSVATAVRNLENSGLS